MLAINPYETSLKELSIESEIPVNDPLLRQALFEIHKGICFYTKTSILFSEMHVDHIYPQALGGKDSIVNYFPSCGSVNSLKSAKYCQQATNELLSINRLLYAPRVLRRYLELQQASGKPSRKVTPKKIKPKLIEETRKGEYRLVQIEPLKKFLRTFSERYPSNIEVIAADRIIIFYDSISDSPEIETELIHSWQYSSEFLQSLDDTQWTSEEKSNAIGYEFKDVVWYKKKPYIERNRLELTLYITDMSDVTLGFKLWKGFDVTEEEIANVELQRSIHQRNVHELLNQMVI